MATVQVDLSTRTITRITATVLAVNLVFTAGTALFIREWSHRDWHGPTGRWLIDRVLVQFHLATENVVAAWYSSMLLLTVALAAALAFAVEKKEVPPIIREKRGGPPFFVGNGGDPLFSYGWLGIAAAFAGLSLDELGSFHERIGMIHRGGAGAAGWVYVLVIPIALVGIFMLGFAWLRLRRVPAAAGLFVVGTALFLSDPVFELFEMALLRAGRGDDLLVHNALLVIEEGPIELGGALCFLLGVLIYIRRTAGDGPHVFTLTHRGVPWIASAGLLLTAGVPAAHWLVERLPPGDTGVPDNWFPAASLYLLALLCLLRRPGHRAAAAIALAISAFFGAAIFGYWGWFQRIGYPGEALDAAVTAVAAILAVALTTEPEPRALSRER